MPIFLSQFSSSTSEIITPFKILSAEMSLTLEISKLLKFWLDLKFSIYLRDHLYQQHLQIYSNF